MERMNFRQRLYRFAADLRAAGMEISTDELAACYRALLLVDWTVEESFSAALFSTLVKDISYAALFERCYRRHFHSASIPAGKDAFREAAARRLEREGEGAAGRGAGTGGADGGGEGSGGSGESAVKAGSGKGERLKNLAEKEFGTLSGDDLKTLEGLVPLIARRLAARMIKKRKKEHPGTLDFRQTFRHSLSCGGIPLELISRPRIRERPALVALCDVSASVWDFSCFSLALVYSLERFFRDVRSFSFIDEIDETTALLRRSGPCALRGLVYRNARVVNEGRTDYGHCLKTFLRRYGNRLSPRSCLLIFGDARNNWFSSEVGALAALREKVRRIYWFNPEPERLWDTGDSIMSHYAACCDRVFSCPNLRELAAAFSRI